MTRPQLTGIRLRARATACGTSWHCTAHCWLRLDHCPELRLMAREVSAAKTPSGVAAPPYTITASAVHYNTLRDA
eukprot:scaffold31949_cov146-Isochrysis_galbana.AAC.2